MTGDDSRLGTLPLPVSIVVGVLLGLFILFLCIQVGVELRRDRHRCDTQRCGWPGCTKKIGDHE